MGSQECGEDVDAHQGHGYATGTQTCNRDLGVQQGHRHAVGTRVCNRDMSMWCAHRHGMGTRTCSEDKNVWWDMVMWVHRDRHATGIEVCDGDVDITGTGWAWGQGCVMGTRGVHSGHGHTQGTWWGHECVMGLQTCNGALGMGWEHRQDKNT